MPLKEEKIVIVLQKSMACNIQFLCSQKWSGGWDKHRAEFLHLFLKTHVANFDILVCFLRPVKLRGSKKYPSFSSFICLKL